MTGRHDGFVRRPLEVSFYDLDGCRVLHLDGECDVATIDQLRTGLDEALAQKRTALIADLSRLRFCDVRSAALLLLAAQTAPIVLVGPAGIPLRVLDLLDPAGEVPRYPTVDCAVNDLSDHR